MVYVAGTGPEDLRESKMDILNADLCNHVREEFDGLPMVRDVTMICAGFTSGVRAACSVSEHILLARFACFSNQIKHS